MKNFINPLEAADKILLRLKKGILLTVKEGDKVNPMTIGWATMGIQWGKPIFMGLVRGSRFTKPILDRSGEFTVNVPLGEVDPAIIRFCGTKSGRDFDKVAELGLTLEDPEVISVPGIRELPLTLECKVIYKQDQDPAAIAKENDDRYYAKGTPNEGDYHTAYYGQIVAAYIIE